MHEHPHPESQPDFAASTWLRFDGDQQSADDPETEAQFHAAYTCLDTLTTHLTVDAGPWTTITAEEIKAEYEHFLTWSGGYASIESEGETDETGIWFSLGNLLALSQRRLNAYQEFGGEQRQEHRIFHHFHQQIAIAAAEEAEVERLIAESQRRFFERTG